MNYTDLFILLIPEVAVTLTALVVLGLDLGLMRRRPVKSRLAMAAFLTTMGCLASSCWLVAYDQPGRFYEGILVISNLNRLVKLILLVLTVFTAWISLSYRFTKHVGEYYVLLLLATVGMMFLVSTENVLMLFVSLELLSLCLYIMTALNKENLASAEAALKYFLFGGMSAAFMLFGLSLLYGVSGQINLQPMSRVLAETQANPVLLIGVIMILVGFGFKVAAVPFHLWAPDTYQGAPLPCAAFIASGSKVAGFYILAKVVMVGLDGMPGAGFSEAAVPGWVPMVECSKIAGLFSRGPGRLYPGWIAGQ
jgi:NADH-quinone oxidoreductase subunit N